MNVGQISKFHNLMFFPARSLLQGWRLGDGQHHAFTHRRLYRGALTHRRVYTQQLLHSWALRRGVFYAQTGLHAAAFTQSSYCTQKASHRGALHRGGFTDRSFYRQKLLHTEAFAQSGFCTEGLYLVQRGFYTLEGCQHPGNQGCDEPRRRNSKAKSYELKRGWLVRTKSRRQNPKDVECCFWVSSAMSNTLWQAMTYLAGVSALRALPSTQ